MYQFISLHLTPEYSLLMQDSDFKAVYNFMMFAQKDVTLREIKRGLPQINNLEQSIEKWVQLNVISRFHGRYQLNGEILTSDKQLSLRQSYDSFFRLYLAQLGDLNKEMRLTLEQWSFYLLKGFINTAIYDKSCPFYIEETSNGININELPLFFQKLHGKKVDWLSFESMLLLTRDCATLPTYFFELQYRRNCQNETFLSLEKLLGDVNISYFLSYTERKIRRIEKGRKLSTDEPDIFLQALVQLDYLTCCEGYYKTSVLSISSNMSKQIDNLVSSVLESFYDEFSKEMDVYALAVFMTMLRESNLFSSQSRYIALEDK